MVVCQGWSTIVILGDLCSFLNLCYSNLLVNKYQRTGETKKLSSLVLSKESGQSLN